MLLKAAIVVSLLGTIAGCRLFDSDEERETYTFTVFDAGGKAWDERCTNGTWWIDLATDRAYSCPGKNLDAVTVVEDTTITVTFNGLLPRTEACGAGVSSDSARYTSPCFALWPVSSYRLVFVGSKWRDEYWVRIDGSTIETIDFPGSSGMITPSNPIHQLDLTLAAH